MGCCAVGMSVFGSPQQRSAEPVSPVTPVFIDIQWKMPLPGLKRFARSEPRMIVKETPGNVWHDDERASRHSISRPRAGDGKNSSRNGRKDSTNPSESALAFTRNDCAKSAWRAVSHPGLRPGLPTPLSAAVLSSIRQRRCHPHASPGVPPARSRLPCTESTRCVLPPPRAARNCPDENRRSR